MILSRGAFALIFIAFLNTGCAPSVIPEPDVSASSDKPDAQTDMENCERELEALHTSSPDKARSLQTRFEQLMQGAAGYTKVRDAVNTGTRHAVDAMYEYHSAVLCAEIRQTTLESLITQQGQG